MAEQSVLCPGVMAFPGKRLPPLCPLLEKYRSLKNGRRLRELAEPENFRLGRAISAFLLASWPPLKLISPSIAPLKANSGYVPDILLFCTKNFP